MNIAVVLPAWNEGEGIADFLMELDEALTPWDVQFVVVDDCSTDDTAVRVLEARDHGVPVRLHRNESNLGHGPSTLLALQIGLASGADAIVALDGDGQFVGSDVRRLLTTLIDSGVLVVEGVRTDRGDPFYRRGVSWTTRLLVWTRCREVPGDANTPLRAYRPALLRRLLAALPDDAATPNLLISTTCRRWDAPREEIAVASIPRRGASVIGTTWGAGLRSIPSRRFVTFCVDAGREWVTTPVSDRPGGSW